MSPYLEHAPLEQRGRHVPPAREANGSAPALSRLCRLLVLHFFVLVLVRLVYEADDFNDWNLVSLLNATAFPSFGELFALPEVHFANPFSFPVYNTGAESVVSLSIHRLIGPISFYWSSVVVLLTYDIDRS